MKKSFRVILSAVAVLIFVILFGCVKNSTPTAPQTRYIPAWTSTISPTITVTPTITQTATITSTLTISPTSSITMTVTVSPTITATGTITATSTQTCTFTASPTIAVPIVISAYIGSNYVTADNAWGVTYDVSVVDANGNTITNAGVTVKNVTNTWQYQVSYNATTASYHIDDTTGMIQYTPGNTYEVDVIAGGVTYIAQSVAPGNDGISTDCNTISWQYDGNNDSFEADNPDGSVALSASDPGLDYNVDISSIYTVSGDYLIYLWLANYYTGVFAGSSPKSNIWVEYDDGWDITN